MLIPKTVQLAESMEVGFHGHLKKTLAPKFPNYKGKKKKENLQDKGNTEKLPLN